LPQVASADVVDDTRENPTVSVPQSGNQGEASYAEMDDETLAKDAPQKENPTASVPQSSNQNEGPSVEMDGETLADDAAEAYYAEMDDGAFVDQAQSKQHPHSDDDLRRLLTLSKGRRRRKKNGLDLLDTQALKRNIEARGGKTGNE